MVEYLAKIASLYAGINTKLSRHALFTVRRREAEASKRPTNAQQGFGANGGAIGKRERTQKKRKNVSAISDPYCAFCCQLIDTSKTIFKCATCGKQCVQNATEKTQGKVGQPSASIQQVGKKRDDLNAATEKGRPDTNEAQNKNQKNPNSAGAKTESEKLDARKSEETKQSTSLLPKKPEETKEPGGLMGLRSMMSGPSEKSSGTGSSEKSSLLRAMMSQKPSNSGKKLSSSSTLKPASNPSAGTNQLSDLRGLMSGKSNSSSSAGGTLQSRMGKKDVGDSSSKKKRQRQDTMERKSNKKSNSVFGSFGDL